MGAHRGPGHGHRCLNRGAHRPRPQPRQFLPRPCPPNRSRPISWRPGPSGYSSARRPPGAVSWHPLRMAASVSRLRQNGRKTAVTSGRSQAGRTASGLAARRLTPCLKRPSNQRVAGRVDVTRPLTVFLPARHPVQQRGTATGARYGSHEQTSTHGLSCTVGSRAGPRR
jgi:hypothetical protein